MAEMEENDANNVTLEIAESLYGQEEEYDEILTPLFLAPDGMSAMTLHCAYE